MRWRVETYICIGKCVPTPASLSRVLHLAPSSGDRTSFTRRVLSLSSAPSPRAFRIGPSFLSRFHSQSIATIPFSLPRATAPLSRARIFFSLMPPFFSSNTPPGPSSDFYNLLLVAPTHHRFAGVCPARPARKNRKIEENKRAAGAPRHLAGVARSDGGRRRGGGRRHGAEGVEKKEKGTAGPSSGSGSSARVCAPLYIPRAR